jgi:regulatory protein
MRITAIERVPRKKRYDVQIDDALVVPLSPDVLFRAGLAIGQEIELDQVRSLEEAERRHAAMSGALRLLAYRPRSEREVRDALAKRGASERVVDETVMRLRELRLLDDAEFAHTYVDLRNGSNPRSRRLLAAELRARGVGKGAVEAPLSEVDEADAAYRAASRKARQISDVSFVDFQRRVGDHLLRRGFGFGLVRETVRRVWEERGGDDGGAQQEDG